MKRPNTSVDVMPGTRADSAGLARNTAFNAGGFLLNAMLNLVALCALARCLGKDELGIYYTIYALLMLVQLTSEAGLTTALPCRMLRRPEHWRTAVSEATSVLVLVLLASTGALWLLGMTWSAFAGDDFRAGPWALAALACAAIHVQRFCAAVFQAFEEFEYENIAKILQGMLFAALVTFGLRRGRDDLHSALALFALSQLAAAGFMALCLARRHRCFGLALRRGLIRDWLSEAGPVGLGDLLRRLSWQIDTLLLGLFQTPALIGVYSIARRPIATLIWVPHVLLAATLPRFVQMGRTDRAALARAYAESIRLLWVLSLPAAIGLSAIALPLVVALAGPEYAEAAVPLRILAWVTVLVFLAVPFRFFLTALGKGREYLRLTSLSVAIVAVADLILIPWSGYVGACIGCFLGEAVLIAGGLAACRTLDIQVLEAGRLLRAALAASAMASLLVCARGLSGPLFLAAAAGATAVYLVGCLLLGAVRLKEFQTLLRHLRPLPIRTVPLPTVEECQTSGSTTLPSGDAPPVSRDGLNSVVVLAAGPARSDAFDSNTRFPGRRPRTAGPARRGLGEQP